MVDPFESGIGKPAERAPEPPRALRAARAAGRVVVGVMGWLADRVDDVAVWAANLLRFLPIRLVRVAGSGVFLLTWAVTLLPSAFGTLRHGGTAALGPWARTRAARAGGRLARLAADLLDLVGFPEIFSLVWRALTRATPLSAPELDTASTVLGAGAMRFHEVRIAEGGVLRWVFRKNGNRGFTTFHTINLPARGAQTRANLDIVLHELVHVYQYERSGGRYVLEALLAQRREGYEYGGASGLQGALTRGRRLEHFNREQQAQIVEDYGRRLRENMDVSDFEPYIAELRRGRL